MRNRITVAGIMLAAALTYAQAQWLNYPDARTPRTKDGKPDLNAPAPRLNDKPDVSGVWQAERTAASEYERVLGPAFTALQIDTHDITRHAVNVFWGMKPEEEPLRPEAASLLKLRRQSPHEFPRTHCLPGGIPLALMIFSFKFVQTPHEIIMMSEGGDPPRQIHIDGRPLPKDPNPAWMGYSAGHWEGSTLVVETVGFNDRAWLDVSGHPRSESMKITERYQRRDFGHMDLEVRIEDPIYYTRPFTIKTTLTLIPDSDVLEYVCSENEKDLPHLVK